MLEGTPVGVSLGPGLGPTEGRSVVGWGEGIEVASGSVGELLGAREGSFEGIGLEVGSALSKLSRKTARIPWFPGSLGEIRERATPDGELEVDGSSETEGKADGFTLVDGIPEGSAVFEGLAEGPVDGAAVADGSIVREGVVDGAALMDGRAEVEGEDEGESEGESEGLTDGNWLAVTVGLEEGVSST